MYAHTCKNYILVGKVGQRIRDRQAGAVNDGALKMLNWPFHSWALSSWGVH